MTIKNHKKIKYSLKITAPSEITNGKIPSNSYGDESGRQRFATYIRFKSEIDVPVKSINKKRTLK